MHTKTFVTYTNKVVLDKPVIVTGSFSNKFSFTGYHPMHSVLVLLLRIKFTPTLCIERVGVSPDSWLGIDVVTGCTWALVCNKDGEWRVNKCVSRWEHTLEPHSKYPFLFQLRKNDEVFSSIRDETGFMRESGCVPCLFLPQVLQVRNDCSTKLVQFDRNPPLIRQFRQCCQTLSNYSAPVTKGVRTIVVRKPNASFAELESRIAAELYITTRISPAPISMFLRGDELNFATNRCKFTLVEWFNEWGGNSGSSSYLIFLDLVSSVMKRLGDLHCDRILHLDIHESNVCVDASLTNTPITPSHLKLIDFGTSVHPSMSGVSKCMVRDIAAMEVSNTRNRGGLWTRMAPERVTGNKSTRLLRSTDVFEALLMCCEYFKSGTGDIFPSKRVRSSSRREHERCVTKLLRSISGCTRHPIPLELRAILMKCLQFDPLDRYVNAYDVVAHCGAIRKTFA